MEQILNSLQEDQEWCKGYMNFEGYAKKLIDAGPTLSVIDDDGIVWACGGVAEQEPHRALSWILIREGIGVSRFRRLHKETTIFFDSLDYNRIELVADAHFDDSSKWATLLGFKLEGLMYEYFPNGRDGFLYARIKSRSERSE